MLIRCWGARGSVPVSGKEYVRYGGDTTCLEVVSRDGKTAIVDAGNGIRRLGNKLLKEGHRSFHIFFTHAHWDHILGFPFFSPIYLSDSIITVYGSRSIHGNMESHLEATMKPPYFPVPYKIIKGRVVLKDLSGDPMQFGSMNISTIHLNHPNMGLGYKFEEDGKKFVFLTDNELGYKHPGGLEFEDYVRFCREADVLFHDAEYKDLEYEKTRGWGHSTFSKAVELGIAAEVKKLGLFHHNQGRTDGQMDEILSACEKKIKENGSGLNVFAVYQDMSIDL